MFKHRDSRGAENVRIGTRKTYCAHKTSQNFEKQREFFEIGISRAIFTPGYLMRTKKRNAKISESRNKSIVLRNSFFLFGGCFFLRFSRELNENLETFSRTCLLLSTFSISLNNHGDRLAGTVGIDRSYRRHR